MSRRERRAAARKQGIDWESVAQRPAARYEKAVSTSKLSGRVAQEASGIIVEKADDSQEAS